MKITDDLKYLAVFIGTIITVLGALLYLAIVMAIGSMGFLSGFGTINGNITSFSSAVFLFLLLVSLQIVLALVSYLYAKKMKTNKEDRMHNSLIIVVLGIILFIIHGGFYIGPVFIILGGIAFYVKEGDIEINIS